MLNYAHFAGQSAFVNHSFWGRFFRWTRFNRLAALIVIFQICLLAASVLATAPQIANKLQLVKELEASFPAASQELAQPEKPLNQTDQGFKTTLNGLDFIFPAKYDGTFGLTDNAVSVAIYPESANHVTGQLEGQSLVYRQAYTATDLLHLVGAKGGKEFLNLQTRAAPGHFDYTLTLNGPETGLTLLDGRVVVTQFGRSRFQVDKPWLIDSSGKKWQEPNIIRWEVTPQPTGTYRLTLALNTAGLAYPLLVDPSWSAPSSLNESRAYYGLAALSNAKALVSGGDINSTLASAELYNATTGNWAPTGSMTYARSLHTLTTLQDGTVLAAGGQNVSAENQQDFDITPAEIYNPTTGVWSSGGIINHARVEHTASLLSNGKVLIAGGRRPSGGLFQTVAELYNPVTHTWQDTGMMLTERAGHKAVTLNNGKVLVVGGEFSSPDLVTAEIYNPATGTWALTGSLNIFRQNFALVAMADGKAMAIGGYSDAPLNNGSHGYLDTTEIYDPATGNWTLGPRLNYERSAAVATLLSDGKIMVAGGRGNVPYGTYVSNAEIYDPTSNTWTTQSEFVAPIVTLTGAVLLSNGKVLGIDGISSEVFDPLSATPNNPVLQSAAGSSSTIREIKWLDKSNNETGFSIERFDQQQYKFVQIATVGANITSYNDDTTGLIGVNTYRIRAYNATGYSGYSQSIYGYQDGPLTPDPSNLVVTSYEPINFNTAVLTWTSNSVKNFIERKVGTNGTWQPFVTASSSPYYDRNLTQGTTYYYRVQTPYASPYTNIASIYDPFPPAAPSNVTIVRLSATSFKVDWTDNSDNETRFVIERKGLGDPDNFFIEVDQVDANTTTFTNNGLNSGVDYIYRVRGLNMGGYSAYSPNGVIVQSPPPASSSTASNAVSSIAIKFNWQYTPEGQSNAADGFIVERQQGSNPYVEVNRAGPDARSFVNYGLTPGTSYNYRVKSYNASGSSAYSTPLAIATPAADYIITTNTDNSSPGTLRAALIAATSGQTIQINVPSTTLTSDLPVPAANVTIAGSCTSGGPQVHLQGSSLVKGLMLSGGSTLYGVELDGFGNNVAALTGNATSPARTGTNQIRCVKIVKNPTP